MANDETKRLILARRARFVAAAVASIAGAGAAVTACEPEVCLSPVSAVDAGMDAPSDGEADADADADAGDGG